MSKRLPDELKKPELAYALRELRHQARLSQRDLVRKVSDSGYPLSEVYYRQCESTAESEKSRRYPSDKTLDAVLDAVGATRDDLQTLMGQGESISTDQPSLSYRVTRNTPAEDAFSSSPPQLIDNLQASSYPGVLGSHSVSQNSMSLSAGPISSALGDLNRAFSSAAAGSPSQTDLAMEQKRLANYDAYPLLTADEQRLVDSIHESARRRRT